MKKRKRHSAEQVVKKLLDADAMLAAGKSISEVLKSLKGRATCRHPTLSSCACL